MFNIYLNIKMFIFGVTVVLYFDTVYHCCCVIKSIVIE